MKHSRVLDRYWLYVWAPPAKRGTSRNVGKWIVHVPKAELDAAWAIIEAAVEAGKLGPAAKTRTASPNPFPIPDAWTVICVYTRDADDIEDVNRVRDQLRELGIRHGLRYKTDDESRREPGGH